MLAGAGLSDAAYALLNDRITFNQDHFYVYRDADSGFNHGFPSNLFDGGAGLIGDITIDAACVDDSAVGCSDDPTRVDRTRGTVMKLTFPSLAVGEFVGVGFQEPNEGPSQPFSQGYDLSDATHVLLEARTTNSGGLSVQFSVGGRNTDVNNPIALTTAWTALSVDLNDLRDPANNLLLAPNLADLQELFAVVLSNQHAPGGGGVLFNDIRFVNMSGGQELAPANPTRQSGGQPAPSFPLGNETFGVLPALIRSVDDGESGFAITGAWAHDEPVVAAYKGDQHTATGNDGSSIATWTFSNLEPRSYEVQATWVANGSNASNAPFRLLDDSLQRDSVTSDQTVAPGDSVFDMGIDWQSLGRVQVESGTLKVELSNLGVNGVVVADGVRIVPTIPPDQAIGNLTTTYESALAVVALLNRGEPEDLANARRIADALVYAVQHDLSVTGAQLPTAPDGSRGLRDAYSSGDLALLNNQGSTGNVAQQGEIRLAGYSGDERLCGASGYCLVLDGAFGGNNAFGIMALMHAYFEFGDPQYLDSAKEIGGWIHGTLVDPNGPFFNVNPADETFGGYFVGYQGTPADPVTDLIRGKSVENNADIFSAFSMIAAAEQAAGDTAVATMWTERANIAGDFVMSLYDPGLPTVERDGHFYVGTVFDGPNGLPSGPGLKLDGPQRATDVINTYEFLDSNTFTVLALAQSPRYRAWIDGMGNPIDWREPVRYALDTFGQTITATINGQPVTYSGFNIVTSPTESGDRPGGPIGGLANGIAWEFTAQMVVAAGFVDQLYGVSEFSTERTFYRDQLELAQGSAPFGDGAGIVAATLDGEDDNDTLGHAPLDQCLGTPFQCIAERVGLAATTWAIFAERDVNLFAPQLPLPQQNEQEFLIDDWNNTVTKVDLDLNYFAGNTGTVETVAGTTTLDLSPDSSGTTGGSLDVAFNFTGQDPNVFAGYKASLFGLETFPAYFLNTDDIYGGLLPFAGRSIEKLQFDARLISAQDLTIKIELKDESGFNVFTRKTIITNGGAWQTIELDFSGPLQGDLTLFNWQQVAMLSLIVERNHEGAGVTNPDTGRFLVDNLRFVDTDGQYPDFDAIKNPIDGELIHFYETEFLDHVRASSSQYFTDWASTSSAAGGIIQDRSTTPDLLTVGGVGFQLTSYVIDAERGYLDRDAARQNVLAILSVLHDQPQGPGSAGTIGHEGFFYHFLDVDGLRKQNVDIPGTPENESLNTVELSTIDTALAVSGAITAGAYFDGEHADEEMIRRLSHDIYARVNWPFMLNPNPGIDSPRDERDMFYLGWKPNESREGAPFAIPDGPGNGSFSGIPNDPDVVDFYTDEGLLIALLAMGSPDPNHRLSRDVWDALIRETDGDSFIKTYPGALFTYEFASAWLDTEELGTDNHQAIHGRPAVPIDFFSNTRDALEATRDYAMGNPNNRVTWQNNGGDTRWGVSAAEGPFEQYFAFASPNTSQDENPGQVNIVEAEDATNVPAGRIMSRIPASNGKTVLLKDGESLLMPLYLPTRNQYEVVVRYSNDNSNTLPSETIEVSIGGSVVGSFPAQDTGDNGEGWDKFTINNPLGPVDFGRGIHNVTIMVSGGDGFGVEIDKVTMQGALEDGTSTVYGAGSAIKHAPEYAIPAVWESQQLDLLHPRFGFADGFNLDVSDAVIKETVGADILRTDGSWANFTGFAIDHGPMLIMIDNYLENDFIPKMFMASIPGPLSQLFPNYVAAFDFGDAPAPYPTRSIDDGAHHQPIGARLGDSRDTESDGQPAPAADGADEDGVMFGVVGLGSGMAAVNIDLQNATEARVDAWLDFDGNGAWDATDQILDNVQVFAGLQTLNFTIPAGAVAGDTYARVRVSSAGDLDVTGLAYDGEVEDYLVTLVSAAAPNVDDVVTNGGDPQRSSVTELVVTFDREVVAPASAFTVTDRDSMVVVDSLVVNSSVIGGKTVSVLTFDPGTSVITRAAGGNSLINGNYQLQIAALQIATVGGGPNMAANFAFGDQPVDAFYRKYGDQNGNDVVDLLDFAEFRRSFGKSDGDAGYLEGFDSDGDAVIGLLDFAAFRRGFGT